MKLTPLLLFLLLLIVLVIAVTTLKPVNSPSTADKEGFVQFQTNVIPQNEVKVPPYSGRSIVKLYDNIFFDRQNANIVEVSSAEFNGNVALNGNSVSGGNIDLTGSTITDINIQTRDGKINHYSVSDGTKVVETPESQINAVSNSFKVNPFYTSICNTTGKYQLFYISWNKDTYVHCIQIEPTPALKSGNNFKPNNIFTHRIPSDQNERINAMYYIDSTVNLVPPSSYDNVNNYNNTYVIEPLYSSSREVYQLSSDIKYDVKNANIIVNYSNNKYINVYDMYGSHTKYTSAPESSAILDRVSANTRGGYSGMWLKNNSDNTTQILYHSYDKHTLVVLFQTDSSNRFKIVNIARFTENGLDRQDTNDIITQDINGPPKPDPNVNPSAISEYYKWYWYWNSNGPGANTNFSNNYLLKTQIVPPVCPSCPVSQVTKSASDFKKEDTIISKTVDATGNVITKTVDATGNVITETVDATGNVINKTVDTAANVLSKTLDTAGNLVKSGASGTADLVKSGASGTADLVKSGVSGTTDLVKSGVSGTVDLVKSGVSGTVDLLKDAGSGAVGVVNNAIGTTGNVLNKLATPQGNVSGTAGNMSPGFAQGSAPIDNYSYYGALQNKGNNYIPITADFSAFGK